MLASLEGLSSSLLGFGLQNELEFSVEKNTMFRIIDHVIEDLKSLLTT